MCSLRGLGLLFQDDFRSRYSANVAIDRNHACEHCGKLFQLLLSFSSSTNHSTLKNRPVLKADTSSRSHNSPEQWVFDSTTIPNPGQTGEIRMVLLGQVAAKSYCH